MKQFFMLSGLPRSGSQLLSSILNQHPEIHSTTTSPLADLILIVKDNWTQISQAIINQHPRQFQNMILGLIDGTYRHIEKPIIVDKNRLWPRYTDFMCQVLESKPKIICTVRDIPDILASYIILIEKNQNTVSFVDQDLLNANLPINTKNRSKVLWEKYVYHPYTSLRIGVNSNQADMLFCSYNDIVFNCQSTIDKICDFLKIESFKVDANNLQKMEENDDYHGGLRGLHDVRSKLQKQSPEPEKILGREIVRNYQNMNLDFWKKYEK